DYLQAVIQKEKIEFMSVAIEQKGKILYEFVGTDGHEKNANFTKDTPLHVASITKIFTSALMIRLMEEGKLSIHDNVRQYIPEYPFDDILLLYLMTHTSGCRQTGGSIPKDKQAFYDGLVREFPADTDFAYFSAGYNVLSDTIERVSGQSIQDYGKTEIFDKLGMKNTRFSPHTGESGMRTTAGDLIKFSRHLLETRKTGEAGVLTPFSVDLMFREMTAGRYDRTPAFFLKSQTRRFGRCFGDLNSEEAAGHAGASGCFLMLDPKYDVIIVILTNGSQTIQQDDANYSRIINLLMARFAK
ncbi:MAG: serine hydrolase domain-containing protein, partial [Chthoniobacterales bacterium]